jgi:hypothetical protein
MKRILLVLSLIGLVSVSIIFSCDKTDIKGPTATKQETTATNPLQKEYVDPGGGGTNCYCPSLTSCKSDCLFSSCCVCWDPTRSEGSCGCYFGIAKCKTAPIGKNSAESNGGKGETHSVTIYPLRLNDFTKFLDIEKVKSDNLKGSIESLTGAAIKSERAEDAKVNSDQYNAFVDEFEKFINSLEIKDKMKVSAYIDKKTAGR